MVSGSYFNPTFQSGSQPVLAQELWLPWVPWIKLDQAEICWGIRDWHKHLIFDQWESLFVNGLKVGVICTRKGYQGYPGCLDQFGSVPKSLRKLIFAKEFDPHSLGVTFCAPEKSGSQPVLSRELWAPRELGSFWIKLKLAEAFGIGINIWFLINGSHFLSMV